MSIGTSRASASSACLSRQGWNEWKDDERGRLGVVAFHAKTCRQPQLRVLMLHSNNFDFAVLSAILLCEFRKALAKLEHEKGDFQRAS
jgi:hypothetical protein